MQQIHKNSHLLKMPLGIIQPMPPHKADVTHDQTF